MTHTRFIRVLAFLTALVMVLGMMPLSKVIPGYKNMIPTAGNYGVSSVSTMAAYAEKNGYGLSKYGLYEHEGAYYFCGAGNYSAVVTNISRECPVSYCHLPVGVYAFGADGKMLL